MHKSLAVALALSTAAIAPSVAHADTAPTPDFSITGSAAVVSQYRFRGLSQSDNRPVVQASITVSHKSGFYLSTWGSSASSNNSPINIGGTEIDVYGGYTHALGKSGVTFDGGVYGYIYPGATAGNYYEVYGSLTKSVGPVSIKAGVNVAPDQKVFDYNFSSPTHSNVYVYGELGYSIPKTPLSLHAHLGHTGGGFDYGKQYLDYTAGVSYKWKSLVFDISVVGTDVTKSDVNKDFGCLGVASCVTFWHRPAKTVAVGSVTASF
jgi:uncharacterized protein (TIGR02001 family)